MAGGVSLEETAITATRSAGPPRILLIEDNPGDARLLREMLAEVPLARFELTRAERLSDALEKVGQQRFDVILSDLSLPDSRGLETFRAVSARAPGTPVVLLTSLNDQELAVQAVQEGAQDYLVKSQVTGDLLVRSLRYAIERQEASHYRALVMEREHFDAAIAMMSDGILLTDSAWRITSANHAACLLLNLPEAEVRGMPLDRALTPFTLSISVEQLRGETDRVTALDIARMHTHPPLFLDGRLTRLFAPNGSLTSAVLTLRDVTAERRAQHLQTNFFTAVSHKLRTPLTVLSLHFGLWKRMSADDWPRGFRQALSACDGELKKLIELVQQLLEFKDLTTQEPPAAPEPVDVKPLVAAAAASVRQRYPGKALELVEQVSPDADHIAVSAEHFRMVLEKLLDNAVKFAGKPAVKVVIEAIRRDAAWNEFRITDNGPGIPHEALDRILQGFTQIEDTSTGNVPGLGVGLYLAARMVQAYGGSLSVHSALGGGTTVVITFPTQSPP